MIEHPSEEALAALRRWIEHETRGRPWGCVVLTGGRTAAAWYGAGFSAESLFEIGSIRKSFNSALLGRGVQDGRIDLQVKAHEVWPELLRISGDPRDRQITLHHLASGTSGWLTGDPPGRRFQYNNAAFTAAEQVTARLYGFPNGEIAPEAERLFRDALGARSWRMYHFPNRFDAKDIDNPGPKLAVDSNLRDLASWGQLWLDEGRRDGRQLIPAGWVKRACSRVNPELAPCIYGYNWFLNLDRAVWPQAPADSFGHVGWGTFRPSGEESRAFLWVCPSLATVAAMVTDVSVGFANDFLQVPMGLTAEWVARVAAAVGRQGGPQGDNR